ncbi:hypothetical protein ACET3Z_017427 [Daucus carota]
MKGASFGESKGSRDALPLPLQLVYDKLKPVELSQKLFLRGGWVSHVYGHGCGCGMITVAGVKALKRQLHMVGRRSGQYSLFVAAD